MEVLDSLSQELAGASDPARVLIIMGSTWVLEDLTTAGSGVLAGSGILPLWIAFGASFLGIFVGDNATYWIGRLATGGASRLPGLRKLASPSAIAKRSEWFSRYGLRVIVASRCIPGTRAPTFFTAGLLRFSYPRFLLVSLLACLLWSTAIVSAGLMLGPKIIELLKALAAQSLLSILAVAGGGALAVRLLMAAVSVRSRQLLRSSIARLRRYEYWPRALFLAPVQLHRAWLMLSRRKLSLVSSGSATFGPAALAQPRFAGDPRVAPTFLLPAGDAPTRAEAVAGWMREQGVAFPIVLKPATEPEPASVVSVPSAEALERALTLSGGDLAAQPWVPGPLELSVTFARGELLSLTESRTPVVIGDGKRTVEALIFADPETLPVAPLLLGRLEGELVRVPGVGERVELLEVRSHALGARLHDAGRLRSDGLVRAIGELAGRVDGLSVATFELRAASEKALEAGQFVVIGLHGPERLPGHVFDPGFTAGRAWAELFRYSRTVAGSP